MVVKGIIDEDFSNYKKCSMFVIFPKCSMKCDIENHIECCHNSSLLKERDIDVSSDSICQRYLENPLTQALVIGGLEPFDSPEDLLDLVQTFRSHFGCTDDIVIYTGYTEDELRDDPTFITIQCFCSIIVKFGRFRPNQEPHFDPILGVSLANDEQYAKYIGES